MTGAEASGAWGARDPADGRDTGAQGIAGGRATGAQGIAGAPAPSPRPLTRRRFLAAGAAALVLAGVGARTWWVNATAPARPDVVRHAAGEWVALDGAFVAERRAEATTGYSLRVGSAERMSYNEFVGTYATDGSEAREGMNVKSLVVLTLGIRNEGSEGGLTISQMYLLPTRRMNEFLVPDADLLLASETKLRESGSDGMGVRIREGTEYEVRLAYEHQGGLVDVGGEQVKEAYFEPLDDVDFELIVSNLPVRNVIAFTAA